MRVTRRHDRCHASRWPLSRGNYVIGKYFRIWYRDFHTRRDQWLAAPGAVTHAAPGRGRGPGHLIEISPCPQCPVSTLPPPTWTQTPLLSLTLLPRNNEENKLKFWFKMNHHLEKIESSENLACLCFAWNINEEVFKKMCTCDKVWSPFRFKTVKRCSSDDYVYSYGSIRTMK